MSLLADLFWSEALTEQDVTVSSRALEDRQVIVEFLRSGDDELFGVLVRRYQDQIFRLVVSILGPNAEAAAEDVVQEIFITVYRKLDTFRGDCAFSTWLYRIARNRAVDGRRRHRPVAAIEEGALQRSASRNPKPDPDSELDRSNRESLVLRQVDELGEPRRTVVFLYYWMGYRVEEVGRVLEIPAGSVKSHLYRARRDLADRLNREVFDGR